MAQGLKGVKSVKALKIAPRLTSFDFFLKKEEIIIIILSICWTPLVCKAVRQIILFTAFYKGTKTRHPQLPQTSFNRVVREKSRASKENFKWSRSRHDWINRTCMKGDEACSTHTASRGENFTPLPKGRVGGNKAQSHKSIKFSMFSSTYCVFSFMSDLFQSTKAFNLMHKKISIKWQNKVSRYLNICCKEYLALLTLIGRHIPWR